NNWIFSQMFIVDYVLFKKIKSRQWFKSLASRSIYKKLDAETNFSTSWLHMHDASYVKPALRKPEAKEADEGIVYIVYCKCEYLSLILHAKFITFLGVWTSATFEAPVPDNQPEFVSNYLSLSTNQTSVNKSVSFDFHR